MYLLFSCHVPLRNLTYPTDFKSKTLNDWTKTVSNVDRKSEQWWTAAADGDLKSFGNCLLSNYPARCLGGGRFALLRVANVDNFESTPNTVKRRQSWWQQIWRKDNNIGLLALFLDFILFVQKRQKNEIQKQCCTA